MQCARSCTSVFTILLFRPLLHLANRLLSRTMLPWSVHNGFLCRHLKLLCATVSPAPQMVHAAVMTSTSTSIPVDIPEVATFEYVCSHYVFPFSCLPSFHIAIPRSTPSAHIRSSLEKPGTQLTAVSVYLSSINRVSTYRVYNCVTVKL